MHRVRRTAASWLVRKIACHQRLGSTRQTDETGREEQRMRKAKNLLAVILFMALLIFLSLEQTEAGHLSFPAAHKGRQSPPRHQAPRQEMPVQRPLFTPTAPPALTWVPRPSVPPPSRSAPQLKKHETPNVTPSTTGTGDVVKRYHT